MPPEIDNLQNLPPEICENWYHIFEEGKYVRIPDIEEMRLSDPFQYENLKRQNIHSIVAMPIYDAEKIIAFYGVDNPPAVSLEYTSDMLQIMGSFLKSCIKRRNLMRRLEDLSYKDALTQLGNRFAMEKYVRQINPEQSIGVVYCDVTGLKGVNDTLGHKAGDDLILRAGACLEQVFGDYGVFRIGGDELLVLCAQIDQDTLAERIRQLECLTAEKDVNIAVGVIWQDRADTHLDELLQEAEKRMYEDKAEYYIETVFPFLGIRLIAVTDNFDSTRKEDMESLALPIRNMVNAMYAKDISKKIWTSLQRKKEAGYAVGNDAPYGYIRNSVTKRNEIDPEAAFYVQLIFQWELMGVPIFEIARRMTLLQVPTPREWHRKMFIVGTHVVINHLTVRAHQRNTKILASTSTSPNSVASITS